MLRKIVFVLTISSLSVWIALWLTEKVFGCSKDYIDGPAGPCTAYMPRALGATADETAKWVSDEKPSRHPQSACGRMEVVCGEAPNMTESDRKTDEFNAQERASAEANTTGKKPN